MWTPFFQQGGACSHTANAVLDILFDVVGSCNQSNQFPEPLDVDGHGHHIY